MPGRSLADVERRDDLALAELVAYQEQDQVTRLGAHPYDLPAEERMEYLREQTLGAVAELIEFLNESGWKSWKSSKFGVTNRQRAADELADVVIFVTNLAIACGLNTEALVDSIRAAQDKNEKRRTEGY